MRIVAIIQARMGSTRLPGKVLMDICGQTMLARVVNRTRGARLIDEIVVATTTNPADDSIVSECRKLNVPVYRGSEEDVLDRYYQAAKTYKAEAVVRITSDCPLLDPEVVDEVIKEFLDHRPDYVSNCLERTYPRGLDVEIMTMQALTRAWHEANKKPERVHVTPYIEQNAGLFQLSSVRSGGDFSRYRWTVDTSEDLSFVRATYSRLRNDNNFHWKDLLKLLLHEPELAKINRHIRQKQTDEC